MGVPAGKEHRQLVLWFQDETREPWGGETGPEQVRMGPSKHSTPAARVQDGVWGCYREVAGGLISRDSMGGRKDTWAGT